MQLEIITKKEFEELKADLCSLIEQGFNDLNKHQEISNCFTTKEVCKLLNITPKTLQTYRDSKLISFSQVGSKIFYSKSDINEFLERFRIKSRFNNPSH